MDGTTSKEEISLLKKVDVGYFNYCKEQSKIHNQCPECEKILQIIMKDHKFYRKCLKCKKEYEIFG